ncbi:MAG: galactose-1-phosphate uridylyltransferase [Limnochordia bacterium]|nr:galactose-1-phosphate uridylyltransferase [Limnochordia bacterium]MDD4518396.1 galactose-1-phosphate uridylyltransferase [Limnochordia bacterium]
MSQLRYDPSTDMWVVIASERGKRPHDFRIAHQEKRGGECPFCYGNEHQTPPEIAVTGRDPDIPNTPGWTVRVVPNKFPALSLEAQGINEVVHVPYKAINGIGVHEVLVESPHHDSTFGTHSIGQLKSIIAMLLQRYYDLRTNPKLKYLQFFKNSGRIAGASLEHAHCQLIATPLVPVVIATETRIATDYFQRHGRCLYCDMLEVELSGTRVVELNDDFLLFCPFASRFPYEMWIMPRRHSHDFGLITDQEISTFCHILSTGIRRLESAFDVIPYNMVLHTAPWEIGHEHYHWHLEILPRLTIVAGFEFGTGYYINPTAPELAANSLRQVEEVISQP